MQLMNTVNLSQLTYIIGEERYVLEKRNSCTQYLYNQSKENNFELASMQDEDAKGYVDICTDEVW